MEEESKPQIIHPRWILIFVILAFVGGAVSGSVASLLIKNSRDAVGVATTASVDKEQRVVVNEQSAVSDAVAGAQPSVVTIVNEQPPRQDNQGNVIQNVSTGSGVIIDDRGFIVTNEHVVHDPGQLKVILYNGEERSALRVSDDAPFTDLAVLRIPAGGLRSLKFGDSDALVPGQTLIAIGSALFEYRNSVTLGVVSALHRRWLREDVWMEDLIQTDAAINNGNSGGPLLNTKGEVVGLTTNVIRRFNGTENVFGIAFGISSSTIRPIVQSIVERGFYPRPYLGIDHTTIDEGVASANRLAVARGALVRRVIDGSPAQQAGIKAGDVILRLGDTDLNDDMPFVNALARLKTNQKTTVQFWRAGRTQEVTVEVQPR